MRAISLTQPYASLIALGAKKIETRSWRTGYRGPLAIHAAQGLGPVGGKRGYEDLCATEPFKTVLTSHLERLIAGGASPLQLANAVPFGAIVAVCNLVNITTSEQMTNAGGIWWTAPSDRLYHYQLTEQERAFGDYNPKRYAWLLADVRALPEPIPATGRQGLWEWTPPEGVLQL